MRGPNYHTNSINFHGATGIKKKKKNGEKKMKEERKQIIQVMSTLRLCFIFVAAG